MSPRAIREQLKVSKDQGPKVKSILRKLVFKELILQKGNLFAHSDLQTGHQHKKKKPFENPRLRHFKKPSVREANIVEGRFIACANRDIRTGFSHHFCSCSPDSFAGSANHRMFAVEGFLSVWEVLSKQVHASPKKPMVIALRYNQSRMALS